MARKSLTYKDSGVDIDAGDEFVDRIQKLVKRTYGPEVMRNDGGFAGLFELNGGAACMLGRNARQPVLVACTDGVGTKLKIAILADIHNTIGIDLVAMNVNDLIVTGAEPLFFLDYIACASLKPSRMVDIVEGITEGCLQAGAALLGGETAEMPGMYAPGDYDLAGFAVGMVDRKKVILGKKVQAGDVVIGLPSTGIHSNGYSLARKIFLEVHKYKLEKHVPDLGCTLAEALLTPTRIYVRPILALLKSYQRKYVIHGIAHITGSGLPGNIPRVIPKGLQVNLHKGSWEIPPIFTLMQELGNVEEAEMYNVFNMGIGMIVVVPSYNADAVVAKLRRMKQKAVMIGEVVPGDGGVHFV